MTINRRLAVLAGCVAAACADPTGFGAGAVRVNAIVGTYPAIDLVQYTAPPLAERRRMSILHGDTVLASILMQPDGGFYAVHFLQSLSGGTSVPPGAWRIVRYDAEWHEVASSTGASLVGSDSLGLGALTLTPDGRFLVGSLGAEVARPGSSDLLVLDPATLQLVRRIPSGYSVGLLPREIFRGWEPTGTTGSQVLMRRFGCPQSAIWVDASTGAVADSITFPCDHSLRGAHAPGQVYIYPFNSGPFVLKLYDGATGQVIASATDTLPTGLPMLDGRHAQLVEIVGGGIALFDAASLETRGLVMFPGTPPGGTQVSHGHVDAATGAFIGAIHDAVACETCLPPSDGIAIIDLDRKQVVLQQSLNTPLSVLP